MKDPSPGICRFNVSSDAEAVFQLWRKLHRTHVACAIDYPLWEFTRAFAAGFTGPPSAAQSEHQKYRAKQAKKARVARKKAALRTAGRQYADAFTYKLRPSLSEKYQEAEILRTELDIHDLPHASTTYIGRQEPSGDSGLTVEELEAQGFVRYGWDGLCVSLFTL